MPIIRNHESHYVTVLDNPPKLTRGRPVDLLSIPASFFQILFLLFLLFCQYIRTNEGRLCLKELFVDRHDPAVVSYTILGGSSKLK